MVEIRIHGRGGQGGVTLAKIVATIYYRRGQATQAFGLYAAERSGAPLQAFIRIDHQEITNRNLIYEPDHIIVLDPALISDATKVGLKPGGWVLLNIAEPAEKYAGLYAGYRLAAVNATQIAREHGLGTLSVPIINTTLAGAFARIFDLPVEQVGQAFEEFNFPEANLRSARTAYECVEIAGLVSGSVRVVPAAPISGRVPGLVDGNTGALPPIRTGTWATRQPRHQNPRPPCNHACPAGNDVQGFIALMNKDRVDQALELLQKTTPFAATCGRVCPAPCMEACNRGEFDEAVNIRELERYAGDHGKSRPKPALRNGHRVAIVGSGPAGLSAAYQLALLGYEVTVHDAAGEFGGVMRTGIPAYRLPPEVLDRDITGILSLGVQAQTNSRIDRDGLVRLSRENVAVFVATGLQELRSLNLGQLDGETIVQGIDFLDLARRGRFRMEGSRVVVVGGGNTAFDSARTALRVGAKEVRIVYRRSREEMPAIAEEIEEALEEGIRIDYLTTPSAFEPKGASSALTCVRNRLGEPDESGRRRPETIEGSGFEIPCDRVILAVGQSADLSVLPEGAEVRDGQMFVGLTSSPILVGGDLETNEGTVTAAIGSGRRVAYHIHRLVSGEDLFPKTASGEVVGYDRMNMNYFERSPQRQSRHLPVPQRIRTFDEVRGGLSGVEEAQRCLSCGVCNQCDTCRLVCPDGVVARNGDRYEFNYEYCKGCGVCATECPRQVIYMSSL